MTGNTKYIYLFHLLIRHKKREVAKCKKGWNPERISSSIGGFANYLDNVGGGYIHVGVE